MNGKCVIDLTQCSYALSYDVPVSGATIDSIIINGTSYTAPATTFVSNVIGIQSWLNGLGFTGVVVGYTPDGSGGLFTLSRADTVNVYGTATFTVGADLVTKAFTRTCASLEQILQAIFDYMCELDATKVALGVTLTLCEIVDDTVVVTPYGSSVKVSEYLAAFAIKFCSLVNKVKELAGINCATITAVFPTSGAPMVATDKLFGSKSGACANITLKDLALAIYELTKEDGEVNNAFCTITCPTDACPACLDLVTSFV